MAILAYLNCNFEVIKSSQVISDHGSARKREGWTSVPLPAKPQYIVKLVFIPVNISDVNIKLLVFKTSLLPPPLKIAIIKIPEFCLNSDSSAVSPFN